MSDAFDSKTNAAQIPVNTLDFMVFHYYQVSPPLMMAQHLGHRAAHDDIMKAMESVLCEAAQLTPDMGGKTNTASLEKSIATSI